jgi:transcriptional regulator with XRE-family HTH domain
MMPRAAAIRRQFGALLSLARELRGMTQQELARRAGMSQATIAKLEGGTVGAELAVVYTLADVLGVSRVRLLP